MRRFGLRAGVLLASLLLTTPSLPSSADLPAADGPDAAAPVVKKIGKRANAITSFEVKASREQVWGVLTDFDDYPKVFKRLKSCHVTRRDGNLVYIESELKPHMFVRVPRNHTVNDLKGRPNILDWDLLDGNFKSVHGRWVLSPAPAGAACRITYSLEVDPGPVIPPFLVSFVLGLVQREIVSSFKEVVEAQPAQSASSDRRPAAGGQG